MAVSLPAAVGEKRSFCVSHGDGLVQAFHLLPLGTVLV